jgi:hypothetical protein
VAETLPQRIQQHQVWTDLNDLDQILIDAEPLLDGADPDIASTHASLVALVKHIQMVLNSINPILASETLLGTISGSINAVHNAVDTAIQQEDAALLTRAWSLADPVFSNLSYLPVVTSRPDMEGITEAIGQFHQHLVELHEGVQQQAKTLGEEIEALEERRIEIATDITSQKEALTTAISDFEAQMATAISEFQEQIAAEQTNQEAAYTEAFAAAQSKLDAATEKGEEFYKQDEDRHQEQIKRFDTEFEALKSGIDTAAREAADANAAQAAALISDLQQHLESAKELVGMIGEVTMTGHYQRNAAEQKKEADRRRYATVAAIIAAVASPAILLWYGLSHRADRDWIDYASRIGVTVALVGLASYLGAQARIHRQLEAKFRSLELELATLDPFLSTMSEKERHNIKTQLASRYFVGADSDAVPLEHLDEPTSTS